MSVGKIHCCLCAVLIEPNEAAMCVECLQTQSNVTDGIATRGEIIQCKKCDRWMIKQDHWGRHRMESTSLMSVCLKKITGLQKPGTKIIEAKWIWTEPHSMRLKIFLEIERAVMDNKVKVRQKLEVEFVIKNKQCMDCIREATDHSWGALIQLRQHVGHKKSFYQLEQLLGEANMHNLMINIEVVREGLDFYFKSKSQSDKVMEFIANHMPCKIKQSKKLVSRDLQSNVSKFEYTIHMEVIPLCKGDLVITSKAHTGSQELMIITKLTASIHLLNPFTLNRAEISGTKFFLKPLSALMTTKQLIPYVVLDVKPLAHPSTATTRSGGKSQLAGFAGAGDAKAVKENGGFLAEVEIAKETDLGENDITYTTTTHLGHILQPGDVVLGYDVQHSVHTAEGEHTVNNLPFDLPDVILVRKSYPENVKTRKRKNNKPSWMKSGPTASNPTLASTVAAVGSMAGESGLVSLEDTVGDFEVVDPSPLAATPPASAAGSRKQKKGGTGGFNLDLLDIDDADKRAIIAQMEDEWEMEQEEQLYLQAVKASSAAASGKSGSAHLSASEWEHLEASLTPPVLSGVLYEDVEDLHQQSDNDEEEEGDDSEMEEGESEGADGDDGYETDSSTDEEQVQS